MKPASRLILRAAIVLALSVLLVHVGLSIASRIALRHAYAALRSAGRPMDAKDLIPKEVPLDDNAAPLYESAFALLASESFGERDLGRALRDTALEYLAQPDSEDKRDAFAPLLDHPVAAQALERIERAAARTRCRFNLDYSQGPMLQTPHVKGMIHVGRLLPAKAVLEARRGDPARAWQTMQTALHMANALRDEPLLLSALIRIAMARQAIDALQLVAATAPPDDETAARTSALLLALEDVAAPLARAVDGERILSGDWILANWSPGSAKEFGAEGTTCMPPAFLMGYRPLLQFNHAWYLKTMGDWAAKFERAPWQESLPTRDTEYSLPWYALTATIVVPSLAGPFSRAGQLQAAARVARTGLALLRHESVHGALPPTLAEIDPSILPEIPLDPFTGQPLVYRPDGHGFLLYSLGENHADDGGTPESPANRDSRAFDVVWRHPGRP